MAERKGNMANQENAFNIMVNLYIIRYLYRHMEKASVFMDETGKRKKSKGFDVEVNLSRQRIINILRGRFMLTKEIKQLSGKFNIESSYFQTNGEYIQIGTLTEKDWKKFFEISKLAYFNEFMTPKEEKEIPRKVEATLESLLDSNAVENTYSSKTALFKVHYYWKNGVPYTANSRITRFIAGLQEVSLADWEEKEDDITELKQYQKLLARHTDYLKKVIDYKEAKMNMQ